MVLKAESVRYLLRLVKSGWAVTTKLPGVTADGCEAVLRERLRDGVRQVLDRRGAVDRSGDSPRTDGRTDIPILLGHLSSHEHAAIIECKRVDGSDSSLCRLYADQGIDRFAGGKYAGSQAPGFMVGYVVLGTPAAAASGANGYLERRGRCAERLEPSPLLCEPWVRESRHLRPSGAPIRLLHAFLEFERGR